MAEIDLNQALKAAMQHHRAGEFGKAEAMYRQILHRDPNHAGALHLLGLLAAKANRVDAAEELIRRAIAINPGAADPYVNLGNILAEAGKFDEAIELYRRALEIKPTSAEGHNNLGNALRGKGKLEESLKCFERALELNPRYPAAHMNRGNTLRMLERFEEAVGTYKKAIELEPGYAEAYGNLGGAYQDLGMYQEAIDALKRAMELRPGFMKAQASRGIALTDMGRIEEAIGAYEQAVKWGPGNAEVHSNLLLTMHYSTRVSAEKIYEEHGLWGQRHAEPLKRLARGHSNDRNPNRPVRVGYVSADFRGHPVSYFFEPILNSHDREQFEIVCYSDVVLEDETTQRLRARAGADGWREIARRSHEEVAEIIRGDGIDILVDLSGHTDSNRLLALARQPAPIQVTYLGYPDTTGMTSMDYRLTDAVADPEGTSDARHSETLVRLPTCAWCYRPLEESPEVGALPARSRGHVTFGSFNVFPKMNSDVMETWAQILKAAPGSRLMIKNKGMKYGPLVERVREFFRGFGIAGGRVECLGSDPSQREHLGRYNQIDIALDTFPYNGTTSTCEAMWMGAPVVTLVGQTHAARVGASLSNAVEMNELAGATKEQYISIAVKLAADVDRLERMRAGLRDRMRQSPLMDAVGLTRELEKAYRQMWRRWCEAGGRS
jgi:protein O-GlcNAc transferase